jgi:hypothetical protein
MNTKYKKSLKIVTLLISALLIATASATIYYSLSVDGTATVDDTYPVALVAGADIGGGSVTGGRTATLAVSAYLGVTLTYENVLTVDNGATTPSVRLRHVSIDDTYADDFVFINIVLLDGSGNQKGYLNYTVSGSASVLTSDTDWEAMAADANWNIRIETQAAATATNGHTADIAIAIDVQE